jgi:hypothetical protein
MSDAPLHFGLDRDVGMLVQSIANSIGLNGGIVEHVRMGVKQNSDCGSL